MSQPLDAVRARQLLKVLGERGLADQLLEHSLLARLEPADGKNEKSLLQGRGIRIPDSRHRLSVLSEVAWPSMGFERKALWAIDLSINRA